MYLCILFYDTFYYIILLYDTFLVDTQKLCALLCAGNRLGSGEDQTMELSKDDCNRLAFISPAIIPIAPLRTQIQVWMK